MSTEFRLEQVERRLDRMGKRMRELELELELGGEGESPIPEPWTPPVSPPPPRRPRIEPAREQQSPQEPPPVRSTIDFEELFGGRVLAWAGGLAILLGAVLFLGMAISRDWIDEVARTMIAMLGSLALLGVGVWLHEGKGRTEAARAAAASGIFGLYATLVVATKTYDLISPSLGFGLAALIAAVGMAIAIRWSSQVVAAIGSLGALAAPLLVGTGGVGSSIGFVFLALVAVTGIVVWQRWGWLVLGAFVVSAPQLAVWVLSADYDYSTESLPVGTGQLLGLLLFWALYLVGALGFELRSRQRRELPVASLLQLFASSALVVGLGYWVFDVTGADDAAVIWMFVCSAGLAALGGLALRLRLDREIGSLLIGIGIGVSALAFAVALSGPALVIAWAAEAVVFAYLATFVEDREDPALSSAERLLFVAGVFLGLALTHLLVFEAPPKALFEGVDDLGSAIAAIGACAAATIVTGLVTRRIHPAASQVAGFVAGGLLVYFGSVVIVDTIGVDALGEARQAGQVWLSVFWTVTGLGAVVWGLVRDSAPVRLGGLALLGVAIAKVWTYDLSELDELARVLSFVGLGLLLLVGAFAYQRIKPGRKADQRSPQDSL
jgi:uncharacterized membrane protein